MASLNEAFSFPLTDNIVSDKEVQKLNVYARGSYTSMKTNTYKQGSLRNSNESDLKMYNEKSLKQPGS